MGDRTRGVATPGRLESRARDAIRGCRRVAVPAAALVSCTVLVLLVLGSAVVVSEWVHDHVVLNLAQLLASAAAAGAVFRRSRQAYGRLRRSWTVLAAACAGWASGQAWWTVQELIGRPAPFPSVADVGFVACPVLAAVALLLHPGARGRIRHTSDAVMTTAAVGLVGWQWVLGPLVEHGSTTTTTEWVLLLGYPTLDVALVVLCVLTAARAQTERPALLLVCAALVSLSVSDSAFAYLQGAMSYSGSSADLGWIVGFLLLGLAGIARIEPWLDDREGAPPEADPAALGASLLPYVPVVVALVATLVRVGTGGRIGPVELVLAALVVALLLVRQYVALQENVRLSRELTAREALLRQRAFHDPLTGLANRALFLDRLEHALALHRRERRPIAVVFLDLDDFKTVNDTLGHAAGDAVVVGVAGRLTATMRDVDTVTRLGGDEFAVLLENGEAGTEAAERARDALGLPFCIGERSLAIRASIGVCTLGPEDATPTAETLIARADEAMYAAKRSGKNRVVRHRSAVAPDGISLEWLALAGSSSP